MKKGTPPPMLYLTADEARTTILSLERLQDELKDTEDAPWSPENRTHRKKIRESTRSALAKLSKLTGIPATGLPDITMQEYRDAFTKES